MNIHTYINNFLLMKEYIKALVENADTNNIPKEELNVIFDGGVFNGVMAAGIALYIKTLEQQQKIKINKISGCSAGALIALWFICGCKESSIHYLEKLIKNFKEDFNFSQLKNLLHDFVNDLFANNLITTSTTTTSTSTSTSTTTTSKMNNDNKKDTKDTKDNTKNMLTILNNRLFINYYDTQEHKQIIVSTYNTKEEIVQSLMRSCFIPYIMDGNARCDERYMDGMVPYLFKDNCETLFVKLVTFNKCSRALVLKSEANIHFRLITGVTDANNFFTTGHSDMCLYIKNRSYYDILFFRGREISAITLFTFIEWMFILKKYLPATLTNSFLYNRIIQVVKGIILDIAERIMI